MKHPLMNVSEICNSIKEMEEKMTVREMIGFCKGNIYKYEYKRENVGTTDKDDVMRSAYYDYMRILLNIDYEYHDVTVNKAYEIVGIEMEHR